MLSNTLYCLERKKTLRVAYFGGSITEGGREHGWRRMTTKWFEANWPDARITEINAAIGGTGTDLGVFRCDRDVIAHSPDLTFIEFAVNDSWMDPDFLMRNTEAIVRKLRLSNPLMDVAFAFTTTGFICDQLAEGKPYASRERHAAIASRYGCPVIDMGTPLQQAVEAEGGDWLLFTTGDRVHPNEKGYAVKIAAMTGALSALLNVPCPNEPAPHSLPEPFFADSPVGAHLEDAFPLTEAYAQPDTAPEYDWSRLLLNLCGRWPTAIGSNKPGAELTFSFTGSTVGAYWMMSSDSGDIDYRIDEGEWRHASSWDHYCLQFARANFRILADHLEPGEHLLTLRISSQNNERSTGRWVRIGAFGVS